MRENNQSELYVLIECHLAKELQFAELVDRINRATSEAFAEQGMSGPTDKSLHELKPLADQVQSGAVEIKEMRQKLLHQINSKTEHEFASVTDAIQSLSEDEQRKLDNSRGDLFNRCESARTKLIENQATLFYTYDFHRRYLAGVLQCNPNTEIYGPDGSSVDNTQGQLYRKSC